ncbi:MAG: beta-N-acetylhexosaminidase [Desulfobacterales bacterium]|nr:beta-N-acetylhexosaminidase [Desulfobacterales bacterium]
MDLTGLSNEQLAGQRLMAGFEGLELNPALRFLIDTLKVGGIILFSRNISTPNQLTLLCSAMQDYARACGQPALFIAVDQEGGQVARLKEPFTRFPGNPYMKNESDAIRFAQITAAELSKVGINMDMAPVLDVAPENISSVMAGRAFGHDPLWVSKLGNLVIQHLQENRILSVAKHFPGIGRTTRDSHSELPTAEVDFNTLKTTDLVPFQAAIERKVAGIMLSHIRFTGIDPRWPASLSVKVAKDLLRKDLGFDGLIFTDDLDMGAVKKHFDIRTVIRRLLLAGIDIALICHSRADMETAFEEIVKDLESSPKQKKKCVASVQRIMEFKRQYLS